MQDKDSFWVLVTGLLIICGFFFWIGFILISICILIYTIWKSSQDSYRSLRGKEIKYDGRPYRVLETYNRKNIKIIGRDGDIRTITTLDWWFWTEKDAEEYKKAQSK
jgi:hypothetical protein